MKYSLSNIILAGIWVGTTKINNSVILNDLMREVALLEKGLENNGLIEFLPQLFKIIEEIHDTTDNTFTFTLNTDDLQVFNNNPKDCWPFFVAVNELPVKTKYSLSNIILARIWVGTTKINNSVILNDLMKEIGLLEEGVEINGEMFEFFCIYGSFDKPARALILNVQNLNGTFGCPFCLAEFCRINMKPIYIQVGFQKVIVKRHCGGSKSISTAINIT